MHSMQISWAVAKYRYITSSSVIAAEYNYRTCNKNLKMQQPLYFIKSKIALHKNNYES